MHTHTLYTHIHTQIRYPCVVKWWIAYVQTRFSQIFPAYPPQILAAFHYRFLSSTALSIDKKKIIGLKLSFKHFVTKNAFFAWKSTFQGGCLFRMKGHKCSECRIPSPQSPCWSTCAMVIPCLWFFMIWGCTELMVSSGADFASPQTFPCLSYIHHTNSACQASNFTTHVSNTSLTSPLLVLNLKSNSY